MAPPAVRASLASVQTSNQRQQHQQEIDAAEYYGLYKTARTLARSYQAVAHQKDDQVKALTREMDGLKQKLAQMEAQQQRLTAGFHDPSTATVAAAGAPSQQPSAPSIRPSATVQPGAPLPVYTLTRNAALFMQAAAATASMRQQPQQYPQQVQNQPPNVRGTATAPATGVANLRQSVDANLLMRARHTPEFLQAAAAAPVSMSYPDMPMQAPVLAPAPVPAVGSGIFSRSARSARVAGEVWSARFSEPLAAHPHPYHHQQQPVEPAEDVAADVADAGSKAKKPKEGKGAISKLKKLMSKSWRSSRDDHTARQDAAVVADGGGSTTVTASGADAHGHQYPHHTHQQQQQHQLHYPRRPAGSGGGGGVVPGSESDMFDAAIAATVASGQGPHGERLSLERHPLPILPDGLSLVPPPLALPAPAAAPGPYEASSALAMTLPSQYLLGAPSTQDQMALNAKHHEEAARQQKKQVLLLQQQKYHQQQLLLLQQRQQQHLAASQRPLQSAGHRSQPQLQMQPHPQSQALGTAAPAGRRLLQYSGSLGRSAALNTAVTDLALARLGQGPQPAGHQGQGSRGAQAVDAIKVRNLLQQQQHEAAAVGGAAPSPALARATATGGKDATPPAPAEGGTSAWSLLVQRSALGQLAQRLKGAGIRRSYDGTLDSTTATATGGRGVSGLVNSGISVHQSWSSDGLATAAMAAAGTLQPAAEVAAASAQPSQRSSSTSLAAARASVTASLSSLSIRAAAAQLNHLPPRPAGRAALATPATAAANANPHSVAATNTSSVALQLSCPAENTFSAAIHPHAKPLPYNTSASAGLLGPEQAGTGGVYHAPATAAAMAAHPDIVSTDAAPAQADARAAAVTPTAVKTKPGSVVTAVPPFSSDAYLEGILGRLKTPSVLLPAAVDGQVVAIVQTDTPITPTPPPTHSSRAGAAAAVAAEAAYGTMDEAIQTETPGKQVGVVGEAASGTLLTPCSAGRVTADEERVLRRDLRRSVGVGWRHKSLGYKNAAPTASFNEKTLGAPWASFTAGISCEHLTPPPQPHSHEQPAPLEPECVQLVEAALAATPGRPAQRDTTSPQLPAAANDSASAAAKTTPTAPALAPVSSRTPTRTSTTSAAANDAVGVRRPVYSPRGAAPPSSPNVDDGNEDEDDGEEETGPYRSPLPRQARDSRGGSQSSEGGQSQPQAHAEAAALWRSSSPRARASARAAAHGVVRSPSPNKNERRAAPLSSGGGGRGRADGGHGLAEATSEEALDDRTRAGNNGAIAMAMSGDRPRRPRGKVALASCRPSSSASASAPSSCSASTVTTTSSGRTLQSRTSQGNLDKGADANNATKGTVAMNATTARAFGLTRTTATATSHGVVTQTLTATLITTGHVPSAAVDACMHDSGADDADGGGLWLTEDPVANGGSSDAAAVAVVSRAASVAAGATKSYGRYAAAGAQGDSSSSEPSTSRSGAWSAEPSPLRSNSVAHHHHYHHHRSLNSDGGAPASVLNGGAATLALAAGKLAAARGKAASYGGAAPSSEPFDLRRDAPIGRVTSLIPTAADVALTDYPSARSNPSASARHIDSGVATAAAAAVAGAGSGGATPSTNSCCPSVTFAPSPSPPVSASDSSVGSWDPTQNSRRGIACGGGVANRSAAATAAAVNLALRQPVNTSGGTSPKDTVTATAPPQLMARVSGGGSDGGAVTVTAAALRLQQNLVEAANAVVEPLAARKRGAVRRRSLAAGLDAAGPRVDAKVVATGSDGGTTVVMAGAVAADGPLLAPRSRHRRWLSHGDADGTDDLDAAAAADDELSARTAMSITTGPEPSSLPAAAAKASACGSDIVKKVQDDAGAVTAAAAQRREREQLLLIRLQERSAAVIQRAWRVRATALAARAAALKAAEAEAVLARVRARVAQAQEEERRRREVARLQERRAAACIQRGWKVHRQRIAAAAANVVAQLSAGRSNPALEAVADPGVNACVSLPSTPGAAVTTTPAITAVAGGARAAGLKAASDSQPGTPVLVLHPLSQQQAVCVRLPSARLCSSGGLKRRLFLPVTSSLDGFDPRGSLLNAGERLRLLRGSLSQSEGGWSGAGASVDAGDAGALAAMEGLRGSFGGRSSSDGGASQTIYAPAPPPAFILPDGADDDVLPSSVPSAVASPAPPPAAPIAVVNAGLSGLLPTATAAPSPVPPSTAQPAPSPVLQQLQPQHPPRASLDLLSSNPMAGAAAPSATSAGGLSSPVVMDASVPLSRSWPASLTVHCPSPTAPPDGAGAATAASPFAAGQSHTDSPAGPIPLGSPMFFCGSTGVAIGTSCFSPSEESDLIRGRIRSRAGSVAGATHHHRPMDHHPAVERRRAVTSGGGVSLISASWDGGRLFPECRTPSLLDAGNIVRRSDGGGAGFVETLRAMRTTDVALLAQLAGAAMDSCLASQELKLPPVPPPQQQPAQQHQTPQQQPRAATASVAGVAAAAPAIEEPLPQQPLPAPNVLQRQDVAYASSADTVATLTAAAAIVAESNTRGNYNCAELNSDDVAVSPRPEAPLVSTPACASRRGATDLIGIRTGCRGISRVPGPTVATPDSFCRTGADEEEDDGEVGWGGVCEAVDQSSPKAALVVTSMAAMVAASLGGAQYDRYGDDDDNVLGAFYEDGAATSSRCFSTTPPTARLLSCGSTTDEEDADVALHEDEQEEEVPGGVPRMRGGLDSDASADTAAASIIKEAEDGEQEGGLGVNGAVIEDARDTEAAIGGDDDDDDTVTEEEQEMGSRYDASDAAAEQEQKDEDEKDDGSDDGDDDILSALQQPLSARTPPHAGRSRLTIAIGSPTALTPTTTDSSNSSAGTSQGDDGDSKSGGGAGGRCGGSGGAKALASPVRWHTSELWEMSHTNPLTPTPAATPNDGAAATVAALALHRRSWPCPRPTPLGGSSGGGGILASAAATAAVAASAGSSGGGSGTAINGSVRPWSSICSAALTGAAGTGVATGHGTTALVCSADFSDVPTDDEACSVRQRCFPAAAPCGQPTVRVEPAAAGGDGASCGSPGKPAASNFPMTDTKPAAAAAEPSSPVRWHTSQLWELVNQLGGGTPPLTITPRDGISSLFNINRRSWSGALSSGGGAAGTAPKPPTVPAAPPSPLQQASATSKGATSNGAAPPGTAASDAAGASPSTGQGADSPTLPVFGGFKVGAAPVTEAWSPAVRMLPCCQSSISHRQDHPLAYTPPPPTPSSTAPPLSPHNPAAAPLSVADSELAAAPAPTPAAVVLSVAPAAVPSAPSPAVAPSHQPSIFALSGQTVGALQFRAAESRPQVPSPSPSELSEAALAAAEATAGSGSGGGNSTPTSAKAPGAAAPAGAAAETGAGRAAPSVVAQQQQLKAPGSSGTVSAPADPTASEAMARVSGSSGAGAAARSGSHRHAPAPSAAASATVTISSASPLSSSESQRPPATTSNDSRSSSGGGGSGHSSGTMFFQSSAQVASSDSGTTIAYIIPKASGGSKALAQATAPIAADGSAVVGVLYPAVGSSGAAAVTAGGAAAIVVAQEQLRRRYTGSPSIVSSLMADADNDASPRLSLPPNKTVCPSATVASIARRISAGSAPSGRAAAAPNVTGSDLPSTPCSAATGAGSGAALWQGHLEVRHHYTTHHNPLAGAAGLSPPPSLPSMVVTDGGPVLLTGGVKVRGILSASAAISTGATTTGGQSRLCRSTRRQQADEEAFCLYGGLALSCDSDDNDGEL